MSSQAANKESNVAAERAAVGMNLIEHQEPTAMVGENVLAVGWADEEVLQHHVVREQNMRGIAPHLFPFALRRAAVILLDSYGARKP